MNTVGSVSKAIIDRYGLKTFLFGLWVFIITLFALSIYVLDTYGAFFLGLKSFVNAIFRFSFPLGTFFFWGSWVFTGVAGLLCIYMIAVRLSRSDEDPLFAPMVTLLLFIVLARFSWAVPAVQETVIHMILEPSGICQLIMVIMLIGLGVNCFQFFSLRSEYHSFIRVKYQLEGLTFRDEEHLNHVIDVMDHSQGLLRRKWQNLKESIEYAQHPDFDTLASFPDQHELLKEGKISLIIRILPVLGIVGTVTGFSLAVVGMLDAASNMNDFYGFKGNLIVSLGGMKSAFLTTLAGMVAMIIVMWLNSLIEESRQRVLLIEAEFLYVRIFLPWLWLIKEK